MKKYAVYAFKKSILKEVKLTTQPCSQGEAKGLLNYFKTGTSENWRSNYKDFKIKLYK